MICRHVNGIAGMIGRRGLIKKDRPTELEQSYLLPVHTYLVIEVIVSRLVLD